MAGFNSVIKAKIYNTAINLNSNYKLLNKTGATKNCQKYTLVRARSFGTMWNKNIYLEYIRAILLLGAE